MFEILFIWWSFKFIDHGGDWGCVWLERLWCDVILYIIFSKKFNRKVCFSKLKIQETEDFSKTENQWKWSFVKTEASKKLRSTRIELNPCKNVSFSKAEPSLKLKLYRV